MKEFDATLTNWSISPIQPFRYGVVSVSGIVHGDKKDRFADGTRISTSEVIDIDLDELLVYTKNSVYKLET